MPDTTSQNYANHARWHPPFHFFLGPGSFVLLILTIVNVVRHYHQLDAWILVFIGILFPVAVVLIRVNPLRVQDRLIRLEERLRLEALATAELNSRIDQLTESQLVALRFASDAELPRLAAKVLASNMQSKDIKKAIVTWRADTFRV
jgi:putative exporter of polyketide antibiotics